MRYSRKLQRKAHRYEAWYGESLVGLVAIYFDFKKKKGFITSVSVESSYRGHGVAKYLLHQALSFGDGNSVMETKLQVNKDSEVLNLYEQMGFQGAEENGEELTMVRFSAA